MNNRSSLCSYTHEQVRAYHGGNRGTNGKIEIVSKVPTRDVLDLTLAYSPGVAKACLDIAKNPADVHELTGVDNTIAVVSDGTAVLGLGNIGPAAGIPVMEGKAVLFKTLAGVDAYPLCLGTTDHDRIIDTVCALAPSLGGVNLEDIAAPACFYIETELKKRLDIPVFHDDQHGTAVVALSGLINALKVVGKNIGDIKLVVNGAGASGIAVTRLCMKAGVKNAILCDSKGAVYKGRTAGMNPFKDLIAEETNLDRLTGSLRDVIKGADVFMGLSVANQVDGDMVKSMAHDPLIFAMANPDPEILPEDALAAGARIVATGRSDYANQINNVLGFPGIFRGALDIRASDINADMCVAAAVGIARLAEDDLREDRIIVSPLHEKVIAEAAREVAKAGIVAGLARIDADPDAIYERCLRFSRYNRQRWAVDEELYGKS